MLIINLLKNRENISFTISKRKKSLGTNEREEVKDASDVKTFHVPVLAESVLCEWDYLK